MAVAKIRVETIQSNEEFMIDPATETILHVQDKGDGSGDICVFIISYVRKQ